MFKNNHHAGVWPFVASGIAVAIGATVAGYARGAAPQELPGVEVVGTTPVPGIDQPRNDIPANIQSLDTRALRDARALSLPELMSSRLNGVNVNEIQGNPFQADVNYRGFTASPLLGTPQGLSVFQDGVRVNEPFGDVVNWDLIPRAAIAGIDLIPGSNPLFGLNTLGGALSIHTKSGLTHPGASLEGQLGSFGRRLAEAEFGRRVGDVGIYAAATKYREDGWRDFSPSDVRQLFGKLSWRSSKVELDLSYTHAETDLIGNGLLPDSMLRARRDSIFTKPDQTRNRMHLVTLGGAYWLSDKSRLAGLIYRRENRTGTLNGDANDEFEGGANDGETGANGGAGFNIDTAALNRSHTRQRGEGGVVQWSHADARNHFAAGVSVDRSRAAFRQSVETGIFDADRGVINPGGEIPTNRLDGRTRTWSVYATDTLKLGAAVALTAALRYNETRVRTTDELNPVPPNLDGDHRYRKWNPALGVTLGAGSAVNVYANLSQGNRAPSPIELGCADPANPCSLPNAMQADPFLKQVVTRTFEVGARGKSGSVSWTAAAFNSINRDDILFVGTSTSAGYFTNFGRTRRQGVELGVSGSSAALAWRASYAHVRATYQSPTCILAENNSSRGQAPECTVNGQDDEILVRAGDRIPGIPRHSVKLGADLKLGERWQVGAEVIAYSSQFVRGNENNAHRAGDATDAFSATRTFLGAGTIAGYALLNLSARVQLGRGWELFAKVNNALDKRYASAGALAENPFAAGVFATNSDDWSRETFFAPGAPRAAFVGLRYAMR